MDYFEALKTSESTSPEFYAHSPVPVPKSNSVGDAIDYIKHTCDDLYFTSDSDEPVELYQLSAAGLHMLEADVDKLTLPSAKDFALFVAGSVTTAEEGFVAEKLPVSGFFARLCNQQVTERQKRLAMSLDRAFAKLTSTPGTGSAYYRIGFPPNIELYVVMLIDGQVVGIKTLSVET
ncbi:hypothetical protein GGI04_000153 [Coemansia thaxteri]|uniref:Uncharacterized protein n=1 Tax=Coemansia thaxteri TaxID=2663907 RepID=A0A9W8EHG8_9FUNG|nr:hypothetical protein H4R26_003613 [Coemansia thaxteri]KAJ2009741.1 hypothetical protein GGI04_000153 [Coemansia thaxteri]KAJ2474380.1 hypothetical protein GGI02_000090 [Coemansia sp. RSA 2322]KAJ2474681.1 hypothetical protein EV174_005547 [Coemansia sp. RSA 2320]